MDKGSGSGIFPDPDLDPGDPKRPDPTGSGSATLVRTDLLAENTCLRTDQCAEKTCVRNGHKYVRNAPHILSF